MFMADDSWKDASPGTAAGAMVMLEVENPRECASLNESKTNLETELRRRYAGQDRASLTGLPVLQAYDAYYTRFKKSYHVQLQLESVVLKGKPIPSVAALVEAMFMAELDNLLLTAGHDLEKIVPPVKVGTARGGEIYTTLRGEEQALKTGDLYMYDQQGVISSILYGPDRRTSLSATTRQALFTVYAPPGIGAARVHHHLECIVDYVRLITPQAAAASVVILEV